MAVPAFGLETGIRALRTAQAAIDTASHNIANANTRGYSRQRVEAQTTNSYTTPSAWYVIGALQIGTGVEARTIMQARDAALDIQLRKGYGDHEASVAQSDILSQVEDALGEPGDSGINAAVAKMFNAFHDLSADPQSATNRNSVISNAQSAAAAIRQVDIRLKNVGTGLDDNLKSGLGDVNTMARQIAMINIEIRKVVAQGDQPNDLRDQRNLLLDDLAKKVNLTVTPASDGTVTVEIGGTAIVRGTQSYNVNALSDLSARGDLTSGQLKGMLDAQTSIAGYQVNLDGMANALRDTVNAQHRAGLDGQGDAGGDFFVGTGASDFAVDSDLPGHPELLAASAVPTPPATFAVGNGENALKLAQIATLKVTTGPITNQTVRDYWSNTATTLGVEVNSLEGNASAQSKFVTQLENRREAVSGVSLDDEMADLVRFQRAYQAAAKLISVADEMAATLINSFGGRA